MSPPARPQAKLASLVEALSKLNFRDVKKISVAANVIWNLLEIFTNHGITPCKRRRYLTDLQSQADQPVLARQLLVLDAQASVKSGSDRHSIEGGEGPELAYLIGRAGREMNALGANLWGINPTQNHYYLHGFGTKLRENARKKRVLEDYSPKLGLVYGACFGFRVCHAAERYTRFGQVKDDVERTLRYWHCDGKVLRFERYGVTKAHKPGQFQVNKGGISSASSVEAHGQEASRALQRILKDFAHPYARLARPGELSSTGLIWRQAETQSEEVPAAAQGGEGTAQKIFNREAQSSEDDGQELQPTKTPMTKRKSDASNDNSSEKKRRKSS